MYIRAKEIESLPNWLQNYSHTPGPRDLRTLTDCGILDAKEHNGRYDEIRSNMWSNN